MKFMISSFRVSLSESTGKLYGSVKKSSTLSSQEYIYVLTTFHSDRHSKILDAGLYQTVLRISAKDILTMNVDTGLEMMSSGSKTSSGTFVPLKFDSASQSSQAISPKKLFSLSEMTEGSLWYDPITTQWHVVFLHFTEKYFKLCSSPPASTTSTISGNIFGTDANSWQCDAIAEIESRWQHDNNIWSYAAKSHPVLLSSQYKSCTARSHQPVMLLSMVSNSVQGPQVIYQPKYKEVYTPKFHLVEKKVAHSKKKSTLSSSLSVKKQQGVGVGDW